MNAFAFVKQFANVTKNQEESRLDADIPPIPDIVGMTITHKNSGNVISKSEKTKYC